MASITSFSLAFSPPAIPKRTLSAKSRFFNCQLRSSHSSIVWPSGSSYQRRAWEVACSTTPFMGRVGLQWRDGNMSLLSFCGGSVCRVSKELYAPALGGIMLSIGIQLSIQDFALAFKRPVPLSVGFVAQYVLKPLLGILVANAFGMPRTFYAGFVLTCCVAGAQLSSYASSLSKADVAMSILLTSSTTIASVLFTPLLSGLLIGSVVPVDALAMSKSILQVVLVPVTLGLVLNTYAKPVVTLLRPVMPFVAMVCTSLCIGSPLSINRSQILSAEGLRLILPVITFHAVAFVLGYWFSKIPGLRQEEEVSRTISLCTGMQSSTLAGLLASQFLGSSQAVPAACSVVVMAIMGLCLASFWGNGFRIRDVLSLLTPQSSGDTAES
ncbi:hypothetical protein Rs2_21356 [Raphanus sativus]|nr:hypothetical protein Rs2_21356 [Raphanus sativus]